MPGRPRADAESLYDASGEMIARYQKGTGWNTAPFRLGHRLLGTYDFGSGVTHFLHSNGIGSSTVITDGTGSVFNEQLFYPWGDLWRDTSAYEFHFAGFDWGYSQAGLDPTPFRMYSYGKGRWMTPDPAGLAVADVTNPDSWNRYAYVGNNPTTFVDPLGLKHCIGPAYSCAAPNLDNEPQGGPNFFPGEDFPGSFDDYYTFGTLDGTDAEGYPSWNYGLDSPTSSWDPAAFNPGIAVLPLRDLRPLFALIPNQCTGTAHVTGLGPNDVPPPAIGAFGIAPPVGSVAIDPKELGLPFDTAAQQIQSNTVLRQYYTQIGVTFQGVPLAAGFPTSFSVSSVIGPPSSRNRPGFARFDILRFPSNAAANRATGDYPVTISFPASAPFVCGRGLTPQ